MQQLSHIHLVQRSNKVEERPPALILLHGIGSNEHDLFALVPSLDPRFLAISVRAPLNVPPWGYGWFEISQTSQGVQVEQLQVEKNLNDLIDFVQQAVIAYGADPKRVYLLGFSQGAIMSEAIALRRPDLVAGVVLMSGAVHPDMILQGEPALNNLPVLMTHGLNDPIFSIVYARAMRDALSSLAIDLTYQEYPMGHEVNQASISLVSSWLSEHLDRAHIS